jgi:ribosomal protein S18 acetylase RimI-like enzyme
MTDRDLVIRTASSADARNLASMHVASWHETYLGIVPDAVLSSLSVDGRTAMWEQILSAPATSGSTVVYLADIEGKIVGFGSCGSQRAEVLKEKGYDGEISAIYVLKAFQRHAIGTRLLYAMASDLSKRGFGSASLWVLRDNAPARLFYEHYGGKVIAEREDVGADGVLIELAYGWTNLMEVARLTSR